jgi:REP element-mobilizing transposase RayT
MFIQPYLPEEIHYAWCYRTYFRWRTFRRRPQPKLRELTAKVLKEVLLPYDIHLLDYAADEIDVRLLVSLRPAESVSSAASKIKGRLSRTVNERCLIHDRQKLFARGYFAITTGQSPATAVQAYLDQQGVGIPIGPVRQSLSVTLN